MKAREERDMGNLNILLKDRYELIERLGRGGMGEVYLAEDKSLSRRVAVKKVLYSDDHLLFRAAEKEAVVLARLRHPGLPQVWDYFSEDRTQYIVMEYISGKDLGEMLQINNAPFPPEQVLAWAEPLLDILEYLHAQRPPVVHRDIKPQNIKITDEGKLYLLDFGLVKDTPTRVRGDSLSLSVYGYSQSYAPLEQINGDPTSVQTDVYELCATLYHLLTNVKPAGALDRATKNIEHKPDPLRPAGEVNPNVPAGLSRILEAGLRLSCDERIKSVQAFRQLLAQEGNRRERVVVNFGDGGGGSDKDEPKPVPPKPRPPGGMRRRYAVIAAAAAVVVLVPAALLADRWINGPGREADKLRNDAEKVERAEGLLSPVPCAAYQDIVARFPGTKAARDLVGKSNDCIIVHNLLQQAEKAEKDKGLNHETADAYRKIVGGYPGSAPAKQAEKRVGEFDKAKQVTVRAWDKMREISEAEIEGESPSQRFRELAVRFGEIDLEGVDPILTAHIRSLREVLNEGKALALTIEQEGFKMGEDKGKEVVQWCQTQYGDAWEDCFKAWMAQNGAAMQEGAERLLATKHQDQISSIEGKFKDIIQKNKDVRANLYDKYRAEFKEIE